MTSPTPPEAPAPPGVTSTTPPTPPGPPADGWWARQSGRTKAILIGIAVILMMSAAGSMTPAESEQTTRDDRTAKRSSTPANPIAALERDVRKNAEDEVGASRVASVECAGPATGCTVEYELGEMWDADDNEVARDIGGMLHELYRDTSANRLTVNALTTTVDDLGNEKANQRVAWIIIDRQGWEKVNWENLKYQDPADGLRAVSSVYADRLR